MSGRLHRFVPAIYRCCVAACGRTGNRKLSLECLDSGTPVYKFMCDEHFGETGLPRPDPATIIILPVIRIPRPDEPNGLGPKKGRRPRRDKRVPHAG